MSLACVSIEYVVTELSWEILKGSSSSKFCDVRAQDGGPDPHLRPWSGRAGGSEEEELLQVEVAFSGKKPVRGGGRRKCFCGYAQTQGGVFNFSSTFC